MNRTADRFDDLAAARKPISSGGDFVRFKFVQIGDELTGTVVEAKTVAGRYGDLRVLAVDPVTAISGGENVTLLGETEVRLTGYVLEHWFDEETPAAGDLISIRLDDLIDTGKDSPMKSYSAAISRDPGGAADNGGDPGPQPDLTADAADIDWGVESEAA